MQFRPCIDIHNGRVKQIVGGSLVDTGNQALDNYVSEQSALHYARLYERYHLTGGHIIILNSRDSSYYEADVRLAKEALTGCPDFLQIGGGVQEDNAREWIHAGASHVIVTSYIFADGKVHMERLIRMAASVGREHLVLDMSCRKKDGRYYIVTDRWQKFTDVLLNEKSMRDLSSYCDEMLIHAVDVEGRRQGVDKELLQILAACDTVPVTYAGGIQSEEDIAFIEKIGKGKLHFTVGSALDIFGGSLSFEKIAKIYNS